MKISVIQMEPGPCKEENIAQAHRLIQSVIAEDAPRLIALPETWSCLGGDPRTRLQQSEEIPARGELQPDPGPAYSFLQTIARENSVFLHGGSIGERVGDRLFNTTLVFSPEGREIARYRKIHLFIEEYRNLHELRVLLEPGVAALAAERATPEQLRDIELWASYDYKSLQKSSYYTSLEWNRKFHISIAAASRNQSLLEIITNTHTRLMRYSYLVIVVDSYGPQLSTEHKALVRAIRARNSTLARECALEHLNKTETRGLRVDWRIANLPIEPNDNILRPPVASRITAREAPTPAAVRSKNAPQKRPRRKLSVVRP
jgi:hypothetical protein